MKKTVSLTTRIIIVVSALLFVVHAALGVVLTLYARRAMLSLISARMLDISDTAAAMINGDDFENFTEDSVGSPEYQKAYDTLKVFQDNFQDNAGCNYIYAVKYVSDENFIFVIDPSENLTDNPDLDPAEYGDPIVYTVAMYNASTGKHDVDDEAHGDEWGVFYSSFSPIYNSAGKVVGIIGVDFIKEWLDSQLSRISWAIVIGLVISLVVGVVIVNISMSGVRKKFKSVNNELANLSGGIDELNEIINLDENPASVDTKDNIKHGESSDVVTTDELSSINVKVRSMHDSLEKFLAYMNKKAYTDMLTGVNNSTAYYNVVAEENEKIRNGTADFAVLVFDLNGLKVINDAYGHAIGDAFILKAVEIMETVFGRINVYRVGGDEFIVVIQKEFGLRIKDIFERIDIATEEVNQKPKPFKERVSFSKGAAVFNPETDTTFKDVFLRADKAMYDDKIAFHSKQS